jgi:hypothetical protein
LRLGIRGGTVREIMTILDDFSLNEPIPLKPTRLGFKDDIDLWYANLNYNKYPTFLKITRFVFKFVKPITGYTFLPTINLAIKKHID